MVHLARTEWLKLRGYWAFWVMIGITFLSYPGINTIMYYAYLDISSQKNEAGELLGLILGQPFAFPEVWKTTAYFSSFFVFIPAVLVIMLITNEYSYKTQRQNIIDGWSRKEFIFAKLINVLIITILITLIYLAVAVTIGIINTKEVKTVFSSHAKSIPLFGLQTFAQLSFAFLVGFLVRRAFLALGIFIFWYMIVENITVQWLKFKSNDEGRFLPLEISDRILPPPSFIARFGEEKYQAMLNAVNIHIVYTFIVLLIIWAFSFWLNSKRDL
jgi:ABC-2 type transport system permease protein